MLVTMKTALEVAYKEQFAIGAFNVGNGEFLQSIIRTAEREESPVILAIHPNELAFLSESFIAYCRDAAIRARVPVVLHMDHGGSLEDIQRAIRAGFTSVMIDGSMLPYEQNVSLTASAVEMVKPLGISVEAELGTVGQAEGSMEGGEEEILYTDPVMAKDFTERTGVHSLAVAIGTAHGMYPPNKKPELKLDLLHEIYGNVKIPLVLHGGSDNKDEEVVASIDYGISKINISSEMKKAFFQTLRAVLNDKERAFEPTEIFPDCMVAADDLIASKMRLFKASGKASLYQGVLQHA
ncbi:ketose-bisphosphate aldolase [Bacillaceae bacterium SIJ1]|uniref:ketose-bisphosphate aldolase n=1 Tax=Litoribacterium kuwaitense TaxID=1398745 RepID=UPI0013EB3FDC|nr:ketose-bisphosphate aldolase [Litoribacterium kuwaitense]NGP46839.1 ketose-bisphosphate aldolase [Litoribacterium kuwaitense]